MDLTAVFLFLEEDLKIRMTVCHLLTLLVRLFSANMPWPMTRKCYYKHCDSSDVTRIRSALWRGAPIKQKILSSVGCMARGWLSAVSRGAPVKCKKKKSITSIATVPT